MHAKDMFVPEIDFQQL